VNIFEAARRLGIKRIAYASSIAAYGAMDEGHGAMHTLYGAYKYCDEQIAKVYSEDWGIHSVGIRPGVVYGVGRDQGLTSKTRSQFWPPPPASPTKCRSRAAYRGSTPERPRAPSFTPSRASGKAPPSST